LSDGCVTGGILPLVRTERKGNEVGETCILDLNILKTYYHQLNLQLLQRAVEKVLDLWYRCIFYIYKTYHSESAQHLIYTFSTPILHHFYSRSKGVF